MSRIRIGLVGAEYHGLGGSTFASNFLRNLCRRFWLVGSYQFFRFQADGETGTDRRSLTSSRVASLFLPSRETTKTPKIGFPASFGTLVVPLFEPQLARFNAFEITALHSLERVQFIVDPAIVRCAGHEPITAVIGQQHPVLLQAGQNHLS